MKSIVYLIRCDCDGYPEDCTQYLCRVSTPEGNWSSSAMLGAYGFSHTLNHDTIALSGYDLSEATNEENIKSLAIDFANLLFKCRALRHPGSRSNNLAIETWEIEHPEGMAISMIRGPKNPHQLTFIKKIERK